MIGSADRHGNLFVLQAQASLITQPPTTLTRNFVICASSDLWLRRLGHPSHSLHKTLSCLFFFILVIMIINVYLAIFVTLLNIISFPLLIALALLLIPFPFCTLIFGVLTQPPMSPINVIFSLWFTVTLGSLGLSLCPTKVKLELTLLTPLLSLLLNFLQHSNAFIMKMVMNF